MRAVVQRVSKASVTVEDLVVGSIASGILVFLGITQGDSKEQVGWLVSKLIQLRIFTDEEGKMNKSLLDIQGSLLVVSQFTLYGDCNEGRRPSFTKAAPSEVAKPLYEAFIKEVKAKGIPVQSGIFGATMQVSLVNEGPVTLILER